MSTLSLTTVTTGTTISSTAHNANLSAIQTFCNNVSAKLDAANTFTSTSTPQVTVAYDGSHSATFSVSSAGVLTINATSTVTITPATTFSGGITVGTGLTLAAGIGVTVQGGTITAGAGNNLPLNAPSGNNVTLSVNSSNVLVASGTGAAVTGTLSASGAVTLSSTLGVTGAVTLSSTLAVSGAVTGGTYNGQTISSSASLTGTLAVSGVTTSAAFKSSTANAATTGIVRLANADKIVARNAANTEDIYLSYLDGTNRIIIGDGSANGTSAMLFVFGAIAGSYTYPLVLDTSFVTVGYTLKTIASTTSAAAVNFPSGVAPSSPNNGDFWFDGTNFKARVGGVTKTFTIT